ncbi:MAG: hypothetical protein PHE24_02240, partial [Patescibacteria group bacterium]|nr:hypothetical protein [Patescibacteria group bacterium]
QKFGQLYGGNWRAMWRQFLDLTGDEVLDDGHHFENRENFCLHQDKLRILDYGSRATQKIVAQYGEKIHNNFDPNKI